MESLANISEYHPHSWKGRDSSRAVLDYAAVAVYAVDHEGRCTEVNQAALDLMGYSKAECLGRDMHALIHATRGDGRPYPPEECPVYEARVKGCAVYDSEETLWTKNGARTHVICSAVPLPSDDRSMGAVVTLIDKPQDVVSSVSAAELLEAEETLKSRLLESEKMASVGRLTSSIAHEINNPLEALTNLLYLARQDDSLSVESSEYLSQAEGELRRVTEIVSQTLRFHRSKSQPTECQPEALIDSVVALQQGKLRNSSIQIARQHRRSRSFLCAEGDLRQIINNLVSNAIDATQSTGGVITIRTAPARNVHSGQEGVRISVSDTGHGMTRETAAQIFEPFYTTKGAGGSGLGLWICNAIAKRHGGRLSVRSSTKRKQRGTTFSLFLPHAPAQAPA